MKKKPLKREQATAAQAAVDKATRKSSFGVIVICPEPGGSRRLELHPWKMTADDAQNIVELLQKKFGLPQVPPPPPNQPVPASPRKAR